MMKKFQVNDIVVESHEPDAALWRVKSVDGRQLSVIDAEKDDGDGKLQTTLMAASKLMAPTIGQMRRLNSN